MAEEDQSQALLSFKELFFCEHAQSYWPRSLSTCVKFPQVPARQTETLELPAFPLFEVAKEGPACIAGETEDARAARRMPCFDLLHRMMLEDVLEKYKNMPCEALWRQRMKDQLRRDDFLLRLPAFKKSCVNEVLPGIWLSIFAVLAYMLVGFVVWFFGCSTVFLFSLAYEPLSFVNISYRFWQVWMAASLFLATLAPTGLVCALFHNLISGLLPRNADMRHFGVLAAPVQILRSIEVHLFPARTTANEVDGPEKVRAARILSWKFAVSSAFAGLAVSLGPASIWFWFAGHTGMEHTLCFEGLCYGEHLWRLKDRASWAVVLALSSLALATVALQLCAHWHWEPGLLAELPMVRHSDLWAAFSMALTLALIMCVAAFMDGFKLHDGIYLAISLIYLAHGGLIHRRIVGTGPEEKRMVGRVLAFWTAVMSGLTFFFMKERFRSWVQEGSALGQEFGQEFDLSRLRGHRLAKLCCALPSMLAAIASLCSGVQGACSETVHAEVSVDSRARIQWAVRAMVHWMLGLLLERLIGDTSLRGGADALRGFGLFLRGLLEALLSFVCVGVLAYLAIVPLAAYELHRDSVGTRAHAALQVLSDCLQRPVPKCTWYLLVLPLCCLAGLLAMAELRHGSLGSGMDGHKLIRFFREDLAHDLRMNCIFMVWMAPLLPAAMEMSRITFAELWHRTRPDIESILRPKEQHVQAACGLGRLEVLGSQALPVKVKLGSIRHKMTHLRKPLSTPAWFENPISYGLRVLPPTFAYMFRTCSKNMLVHFLGRFETGYKPYGVVMGDSWLMRYLMLPVFVGLVTEIGVLAFGWYSTACFGDDFSRYEKVDVVAALRNATEEGIRHHARTSTAGQAAKLAAVESVEAVELWLSSWSQFYLVCIALNLVQFTFNFFWWVCSGYFKPLSCLATALANALSFQALVHTMIQVRDGSGPQLDKDTWISLSFLFTLVRLFAAIKPTVHDNYADMLRMILQQGRAPEALHLFAVSAVDLNESMAFSSQLTEAALFRAITLAASKYMAVLGGRPSLVDYALFLGQFMVISLYTPVATSGLRYQRIQALVEGIRCTPSAPVQTQPAGPSASVQLLGPFEHHEPGKTLTERAFVAKLMSDNRGRLPTWQPEEVAAAAVWAPRLMVDKAAPGTYGEELRGRGWPVWQPEEGCDSGSFGLLAVQGWRLRLVPRELKSPLLDGGSTWCLEVTVPAKLWAVWTVTATLSVLKPGGNEGSQEFHFVERQVMAGETSGHLGPGLVGLGLWQGLGWGNSCKILRERPGWWKFIFGWPGTHQIIPGRQLGEFQNPQAPGSEWQPFLHLVFSVHACTAEHGRPPAACCSAAPANEEAGKQEPLACAPSFIELGDLLSPEQLHQLLWGSCVGGMCPAPEQQEHPSEPNGYAVVHQNPQA